jgi:hypothetical protein
MRIVPRAGHSFYAKLIVSLELPASLGIPVSETETKRETARCGMKFHQCIKLTQDNALQMGTGIPYNPKVSRTKALPGERIPGCTGYGEVRLRT